MAKKTFNLVEVMNIISVIRNIPVDDFLCIAAEDPTCTKFTYVLKDSGKSEVINLTALELHGYSLLTEEKAAEIKQG